MKAIWTYNVFNSAFRLVISTFLIGLTHRLVYREYIYLALA